MKSGVTRLLCASAVLCSVIEGGAQQDPRVGLKAGLRDAGQAARNMELVASLPKPEGFFDPSTPAGETTEPETATPAQPAATPPAAGLSISTQPRPFPPRISSASARGMQVRLRRSGR